MISINFKGLLTIFFLIISNTFMITAWYGHLKWFPKSGIYFTVLISWSLAFFEYCFQVPANRIGFAGNGGPFTLVQLKVTQEVITLMVFSIFSAIVFKNKLNINQIIGFGFLILSVFFIFKR